MKKLNLKKIKFKELFVQHVEKIVLSAAGLMLLLFGFSALSREVLPTEMGADKLTATAIQATKHVEKGKLNPSLVRPADAPIYHERAVRQPVSFASYQASIPFNDVITDSRQPRTQPPILSVADLRVNSGFAPFALLPPEKVVQGPKRPRARPGQVDANAGNEPARVVDRTDVPGVRVPRDAKLVVKYWAMITALVPLRKQKDEYRKTLETAVNYNPEEDLPNYRGYQIERAEVTSGDLTKLTWKPIDLKAATAFTYEWAVEVPEPVMTEYVTGLFVQPLGPRVASDWEPYVGHLPEIPFEPKARVNGSGRAGAMGAMGGDFGMGEPGEGGGPMGPRGPAMGGVEEEEDAEGWGDNRRKRPKDIAEDPAERARKSEVVALLGEKPIKGIDSTLFRFCDYTVQPGKQYVYRVRLGLRNPNNGLPVKFLKKPELKDLTTLVSEWSETSPVVTIPHGDKLLAGPVTPPTVMKEPAGKIRVAQVSEKVGTELPLEADVSRGTLANFYDREVEYIDPSDNTVKTTRADFVTDSVVLDMRGGKPLTPKEKAVTEPGELLVLDRYGRIIAMNEFEDEESWKEYVAPEEGKKPGGGAANPYQQMPGEDLLGPPAKGGKKAGRQGTPKASPDARPQPPNVKPAKTKPVKTAQR